MTRIQVVLLALAAILLVALFLVFAVQPLREEAADLEAQIETEEVEQQRLRGEIERLESVRDFAAEVEAEVQAADAIVPSGPDLPPSLRQIQLAADEAGLRLSSVSASRPTNLGSEAVPTLHRIDISLQLSGRYFQTVDFLRRIEEPGISPRGIRWTSLTVTRAEYPELSISLTGSSFATIAEPVIEVEPEEGSDADGDVDTEQDQDGDGDAEVDG